MSTEQKQSEPKQSANPAKGNLQGQTTLAAKIDRWQHMSNNVQAQIENFPQLKEFQAKFQQILTEANALRSEMMVIEASALNATSRRNALIQAGDDLFSRLNHGLRSALGPKSEHLVQYGLRRGKAGRKSKAAGSTPNPGSSTPESPAASGSTGK